MFSKYKTLIEKSKEFCIPLIELVLTPEDEIF